MAKTGRYAKCVKKEKAKNGSKPKGAKTRPYSKCAAKMKKKR